MRTSFDSPRRTQGHQQTSSTIPSSNQGGAVSIQGEAAQEKPHSLFKQEDHAASHIRTTAQQLTQAYQDRSTQEQVTKPKHQGLGPVPKKIQTRAIIEHQSIRNRPLPAIPTEESDENKNLTPKTASPAKRNEPPSLVKSNHQILTRAELQQHIQSQLNVIYWTTSSSSG